MIRQSSDKSSSSVVVKSPPQGGNIFSLANGIGIDERLHRRLAIAPSALMGSLFGVNFSHGPNRLEARRWFCTVSF